MTPKQAEAIRRIARLGYAVEFDRWENNGIVRVSMARKWRPGVFDVLIRPDGTYRGAGYIRWDVLARRAA